MKKNKCTIIKKDKCSLCGNEVQMTLDRERFCASCGWIEDKK